MRVWSYQCMLLAALFIFGCGKSEKQTDTASVFAYKGDVVTKALGRCDTVSNKGVSLRIRLWEPAGSGAAEKQIRDILAAKLVQRINSYADSASIAANPGATGSTEAAFDVFQKNYNDFRVSFPDSPGCWEVDLKGDTVMATPKVMLYQLDHFAFTGGAHPNSFRSYHIFDVTTGAEKEAREFVTDSVALLNLVEKKFRAVEKIPSDKNLEEEGYFLLNNQFFVPGNYTFTRQGVLFYYNPYEIAAYARGAIQFVIPYAELDGIIARDKIF